MKPKITFKVEGWDEFISNMDNLSFRLESFVVKRKLATLGFGLSESNQLIEAAGIDAINVDEIEEIK